MVFRWHPNPLLEAGTKFRPSAAASFGAPTVEEVHQTSDGHARAVLVNSSDPSIRKMLAVSALPDPALFRPIDPTES